MDDEPSHPEQRPPEARTKALAVGLVIAIGAAAAFAFLWVRDREPTGEEVTAYLGRDKDEISRTATAALEALMNYDADSIEGRRAELEPLLTGSLRAQYDEIITGGLDRALQQTGATAEADIVSGPDVAFTSGERAEATARLVQQVTLEDRETPITGFYVLRLALIPQEGRWRVDRFEILSQHRSE